MITNTRTFPIREDLKRYLDMYLSIGYERKEGRRVPNGTKHKLVLKCDSTVIELYHR